MSVLINGVVYGFLIGGKCIIVWKYYCIKVHYNVIPNATPKKSELLRIINITFLHQLKILTIFSPSYLILHIFRPQTYC